MRNSHIDQQEPYSSAPLSAGIRSRFLEANGLRVHVLEAGYETPGRPCILLLHGFPELAYSWRKNMLPLAEQGYHVIAPDLRGCGRTTGWEQGYDVNLHAFGTLNMVTDAVSLVAAAGHTQVRLVVGHDAGVQIAAFAALIRPDIFQSLALMSIPFGGVAGLGNGSLPGPFAEDPIHRELKTLPRPRKHYTLYFSSPEADRDMLCAAQGLNDFLRAYFHCKSADREENHPHPLSAWSAETLAELPEYYIMEADRDMPATAARMMPTGKQIDDCAWLTDGELAVYAEEYRRTGFQGALNWYRTGTNGLNAQETRLFAGRRIQVPTMFLAGRSDWGAYQFPGSLEAMESAACEDYRGSFFLDHAGHWVQQEQPEKTNELLIQFLASTDREITRRSELNKGKTQQARRRYD